VRVGICAQETEEKVKMDLSNMDASPLRALSPQIPAELCASCVHGMGERRQEDEAPSSFYSKIL
jgi:hypothetical protein